MMNLRFYSKHAVTVLIIIIISGCSGGDVNPVSPVEGPNTPQEELRITVVDEKAEHGRMLWGMWQIHYDPVQDEVALIPARELMTHFNITDMILPPACNDCVTIEFLGYDPEYHFISVNVTLRNPFQITGYDVRGIIYTNDYGHLLLNDDSWTGLFDIPGGQDINPFISFSKFMLFGMFPPGWEQSEMMAIHVPQPPLISQITFAVDACWPGSAKEPYLIYKFKQVDELDVIPGSQASIYVWVEDHQENVSQVLLHAPEITGEDWTPFISDTGFFWEMELTNNEGAEFGDYEVLIKATSYDSPHAIYKYETVMVTSSLDPDPVDVTPPWLNFCPQSVFYEGDYAYVAGHWNGFHIFDVSDKSNPEWVSKVDISGETLDVFVTGGYAYVGNEYYGLQIIDVSTPEYPTVVGEYDIDEVEAVWVSGDYAYIAAGVHNRLFSIIDINPPDEAYEVGYINEYNGYHPQDVIVKGDYAYLAHSPQDVRVIDISNPVTPTVVHNVEVEYNVLGLDIQGNYLYVANNWAGITIIDITEPESAYIVKTLETENASAIRAVGGYAYVADEKQGVHIIDIDPIADASVVNTIPTGGKVKSLDYHNGYVFAGDELLGLFVIDVDPPGSASVVGERYTAGMAVADPAYENGIAYVPNQFGGMMAFDVDPASSAEYVTRIAADTVCKSVDVSSGTLFMTDSGTELRIFDISIPGIINPITAVDLGSTGTDVFLSDGLAYVTSITDGLFIIDVDPPATSNIIKNVEGAFKAVDVQDGYAYVLDNMGPLRIIDIDPVELASIVHSVDFVLSRKVDAYGDYAYVACGQDGWSVVDISMPESASVIKTFEGTNEIYDVKVESGYAYVLDYYALDVYDIYPLDEAHIMDWLNIPTAYSLALYDNFIYVGARERGLRIIQLW